MEASPALHTLIDGVDATLIDLAAEEIGEDELLHLAIKLADQTFTSRQAGGASKTLFRTVFELRARRVSGIRSVGRLDWIRERYQSLDALFVESGLLPRRQTWDDVSNPTDAALVGAILEWAWGHKELQKAVRDGYRLDDDADTNSVRQSFFDTVTLWLSGSCFVEMAMRANLSVDDLLGVHAHALTFVLQTIAEQGVALLAKLLESQGRRISRAVTQFSEHLRFGVPNEAALILASGGVRHRRAAVELGTAAEVMAAVIQNRLAVFSAAQQLLLEDQRRWNSHLGVLVFKSTLQDLTSITGL